MAYSVSERRISRRYERSVSSRIVEMRSMIRWNGTHTADTYDEQKAWLAFDGSLPATWTDSGGTLYLDTVAVDEEDGGNGFWNGYARYVPNTIQLVIGQERRAFNTNAGTQHFIVGKARIRGVACDGGTAPNWGDIIGATQNGDVLGEDVLVSHHEIEITRAFSDDDIDNTYEGILAAATGTVNAGPFRGHAAGTVLFVGAAGAQRGDGIQELSFKFIVQLDRTVNIAGQGGTATLTGVNGWNVVWAYYTKVDIGIGAPTDVAKYVFEERVYDSSDFSALGINTS